LRVLITAVQTPFIDGGANFLVKSLYREMKKRKIDVEVAQFVFKYFPNSDIMKNIDAWLAQDFTQINGITIDKVVALQFPTYYLKHPNKTLWLMHQHRAVYDLYDSKTATDDLKELKDTITKLDYLHLKNIDNKFTISKNVSQRLVKYNCINSIPLYHPPYEEEKFYTDKSEDFIFLPSRLEKLKRQDLLIEAMSFTKSPLKAIIAGEGSHFKIYKELIERLNLGHKVKLIGKVTQEEKFNYYANALAVAYPPLDEDYGYVTLEAMLSSKPIITCHDSGGVLEFVYDGLNGFVVAPDPQAIAQKIDYLYHNKNRAKQMGKNALEVYQQKNISWDNVIEKLLGEKY